MSRFVWPGRWLATPRQGGVGGIAWVGLVWRRVSRVVWHAAAMLRMGELTQVFECRYLRGELDQHALQANRFGL